MNTTMFNKAHKNTLNRPYDYDEVNFEAYCCAPLSRLVINEESVYESAALSASSSFRSGWGSIESRKSCMSLTSLAEENLSRPLPRRIVSQPVEGDGWGYFVDTKENSF